MNKLISLKDSSYEENDSNKQNQRNNQSKNKLEEILCNHCGRTKSNGLRCLGICVADNDY